MRAAGPWVCAEEAAGVLPSAMGHVPLHYAALARVATCQLAFALARESSFPFLSCGQGRSHGHTLGRAKHAALSVCGADAMVSSRRSTLWHRPSATPALPPPARRSLQLRRQPRRAV